MRAKRCARKKLRLFGARAQRCLAIWAIEGSGRRAGRTAVPGRQSNIAGAWASRARGRRGARTGLGREIPLPTAVPFRVIPLFALGARAAATNNLVTSAAWLLPDCFSGGAALRGDASASGGWGSAGEGHAWRAAPPRPGPRHGRLHAGFLPGPFRSPASTAPLLSPRASRRADGESGRGLAPASAQPCPNSGVTQLLPRSKRDAFRGPCPMATRALGAGQVSNRFREIESLSVLQIWLECSLGDCRFFGAALLARREGEPTAHWRRTLVLLRVALPGALRMLRLRERKLVARWTRAQGRWAGAEGALLSVVTGAAQRGWTAPRVGPPAGTRTPLQVRAKSVGSGAMAHAPRLLGGGGARMQGHGTHATQARGSSHRLRCRLQRLASRSLWPALWWRWRHGYVSKAPSLAHAAVTARRCGFLCGQRAQPAGRCTCRGGRGWGGYLRARMTAAARERSLCPLVRAARLMGGRLIAACAGCARRRGNEPVIGGCPAGPDASTADEIEASRPARRLRRFWAENARRRGRHRKDRRARRAAPPVDARPAAAGRDARGDGGGAGGGRASERLMRAPAALRSASRTPPGAPRRGVSPRFFARVGPAVPATQRPPSRLRVPVQVRVSASSWSELVKCVLPQRVRAPCRRVHAPERGSRVRGPIACLQKRGRPPPRGQRPLLPDARARARAPAQLGANAAAPSDHGPLPGWLPCPSKAAQHMVQRAAAAAATHGALRRRRRLATAGPAARWPRRRHRRHSSRQETWKVCIRHWPTARRPSASFLVSSRSVRCHRGGLRGPIPLLRPPRRVRWSGERHLGWGHFTIASTSVDARLLRRPPRASEPVAGRRRRVARCAVRATTRGRRPRPGELSISVRESGGGGSGGCDAEGCVLETPGSHPALGDENCLSRAKELAPGALAIWATEAAAPAPENRSQGAIGTIAAWASRARGAGRATAGRNTPPDCPSRPRIPLFALGARGRAATNNLVTSAAWRW
ncbi:Protein of unknown function [Gryllus bimaculatus]|nr:Protein of unknown function [Gryllus bimaculatus]